VAGPDCDLLLLWERWAFEYVIISAALKRAGEPLFDKCRGGKAGFVVEMVGRERSAHRAIADDLSK